MIQHIVSPTTILVCTKCHGQYQAAEGFYTSKHTTNGYRCHCKSCEKQDSAARRAKLCGFCGKKKHRNQFSKMTEALDGLQSYCRSCFKKYRSMSKTSSIKKAAKPARTKLLPKEEPVSVSYVDKNGHIHVHIFITTNGKVNGRNR